MAEIGNDALAGAGEGAALAAASILLHLAQVFETSRTTPLQRGRAALAAMVWVGGLPLVVVASSLKKATTGNSLFS